MGSGGSASSKVKEMPEEEMMQIFRTYDTDNNGIDEMELGPMLEDLGFLQGTAEENVNLLQRLFTEILPQVDDNHDERLQYEEFKRFVVLACELDTKKKKRVIKGRDAKKLDSSVEAQRKQKEEERLRRRAEQAAELARHNQEMKARLKEAKKSGRDAKKESAEATAARKEKERQRLESVRARRTDMRQREKDLDHMAKTAHGRDEKSLSAETEALRERTAREHAAKKDEEAKAMTLHANQLNELVGNVTTGRDEKSLSADTEALREKTAREHAAKKEEEAKAMTLHAKELNELVGK